jgi:hypothetical protein
VIATRCTNAAHTDRDLALLLLATAIAGVGCHFNSALLGTLAALIAGVAVLVTTVHRVGCRRCPHSTRIIRCKVGAADRGARGGAR